MKKLALMMIVLVPLSLLIGVSNIDAASQTYRVSVTIPAIPGVNVPSLEGDVDDIMNLKPNEEGEESIEQDISNSFQIIREKIWKHDRRIILVTLIEK
tara:strand:- start:3 stop:296 length:294 start_codon:yes stop_codon:yes gene_type:complete